VPRDAYWSWGLHDSLIVVIPSLDLVIARAGPTGTGWKRVKGADHYEVLKPFLEPIAAAVPAETEHPGAGAINPGPKPPYPPEPWGPWRTVFFTNEWDVGPGETSSFPPNG
jgi:hypothetical protein